MYRLNWNNLDKKIPKDYDKLVIPSIENACKFVMGNTIKNKIYNYIVHGFNRGISEGVLESLYIYSGGKTKRVYYKIEANKIEVKLL